MIKKGFFNFVGKGINSLVNIILTPFLLDNLGLEKYGIIALYLLILSIFLAFEMGLGTSLIKRVSVESNQDISTLKNTIFTYETIYLSLGFISFLVIVLLNFLNLEVFKSISFFEHLIFGLLILTQFLIIVYNSILHGLGQQIYLNKIGIVIGITKGLLILVVFKLHHATLISYFMILLSMNILSMLLFKKQVENDQSLKFFRLPKFDLAIFLSDVKINKGLAMNSLISAFTSQIDKIIITSFIGIKELGLYQIGITLTSFIWTIIQPFNQTIVPYISQRVHSNLSKQKTLDLTNFLSKFTTFIMTPIIAWLIINVDEVLNYWIGNLDTDNSKLINITTIFLIIGSYLNVICTVPGTFLIVNEWMDILKKVNSFQIFFGIPITLLLSYNHGLIGAGLASLINNLIYSMYLVPQVFKRQQIHNYTYWSLQIFIIPSLLLIFFSLILKNLLSNFIISHSFSQWGLIQVLVIVSLYSITLLYFKELRQYIFKYIKNYN